MTFPRVGAALSAVLFLALGGCAANTPGQSPVNPMSASTSGDTADVQLLTYDSAQAEGFSEALFEGRLVTTADEKYLYGQTPDGQRLGMVFPEGTKLHDDATAVHLPDGTVIALDTDVQLGGGYATSKAEATHEDAFEEYFYVNPAT